MSDSPACAGGYNHCCMATALRSFAKINLGLAIGPSRADGFHALTTVYQTIDLFDLMRVEARLAVRTRIEITTNHERVPTNVKNTAWRAVELALAAMSVSAQVLLHIEKKLPVQGGLGAGSANAAAALLGLERELGIRLPGPDRLRIAAEIGSDVPLFLLGGTVLGLGRGEEVYPLPDLPATECVVAVPAIGVSTPEAFRAWDALHPVPPSPPSSASSHPTALTGTDPAATLKGLSRSIAAAWSEPHSSGVFPPHTSQGGAEKRADLAETPLLALVHTGIANDFETVVFPQHSLLGEIKRLLAGSGHAGEGAFHAALSGSGAALFGLYATPEAADAAAERLRMHGVPALRTRTLPRETYWRKMVVEDGSR